MITNEYEMFYWDVGLGLDLRFFQSRQLFIFGKLIKNACLPFNLTMKFGLFYCDASLNLALELGSE